MSQRHPLQSRVCFCAGRRESVRTLGLSFRRDWEKSECQGSNSLCLASSGVSWRGEGVGWVITTPTAHRAPTVCQENTTSSHLHVVTQLALTFPF